MIAVIRYPAFLVDVLTINWTRSPLRKSLACVPIQYYSQYIIFLHYFIPASVTTRTCRVQITDIWLEYTCNVVLLSLHCMCMYSRDVYTVACSFLCNKVRAKTTGYKFLFCDFLGWVGVTCNRGQSVTIKAYTPGGVGCHTRPSLLPFAVSRKGKRIRGSRAFSQRKALVGRWCGVVQWGMTVTSCNNSLCSAKLINIWTPYIM